MENDHLIFLNEALKSYRDRNKETLKGIFDNENQTPWLLPYIRLDKDGDFTIIFLQNDQFAELDKNSKVPGITIEQKYLKPKIEIFGL